MDYQEKIIKHYEKIWKTDPNINLWSEGPFNELPMNFRILEFPPTEERNFWTYSTCCMSQPDEIHPLELHIFSAIRDDKLIELLTVIAHYHRTGIRVNLNHTVNFGRSWQDQSDCKYGLISLPYLDGPELENLELSELHGKVIKFYWLIPITKNELEFKKNKGVTALENLFEKDQFNFLDPLRKSVV